MSRPHLNEYYIAGQFNANAQDVWTGLSFLPSSSFFMGRLRKKSRRDHAFPPIMGLDKDYRNPIKEDETMTHHTLRTSSDPVAEIEVIGPYSPWPRRARPRFRTKWTDAGSGVFRAYSSDDLSSYDLSSYDLPFSN
jgi:hypothetical protein